MRRRGPARWVNRALVLAGVVVLVVGVLELLGAPTASSHRHTDPTSGDLDVASAMVVCATGVGLVLWGWHRGAPRDGPGA